MSFVERLARRIVTAPQPTQPALRPMFVDVECAENEEVVWTWTETGAGSVVSGCRVAQASV